MERRPDPKGLLEYVQKEEQSHRHGKLKVFLGAAPGVGKTYSMLEDALTKLEQGVDVVAGIVETHGRKETELLLKNFEILPKRKIYYRGKELEEFDLDAVLLRHPHLILVDEMAHANAPNSRHNKRWQDIMELLDRGIDVYTTVNVQHVESLNNIITQITGIIVRETVPDTILERAHAIELIDLPPEDLIKRLQEGKVYVPTDVGIAIEHFFRKSNLTALRELALRITAEQVNAEVLLHRQGEQIEKIWPTSERLLVCVGPDSDASMLIRATFRMAKSLQAEWMAVFVETPLFQLSNEASHKISQNLRLAEELCGEILTICGSNIVDEIINLAHNRNITKIIVGKRVKSRWKDLFSRSLADELVRHSHDVDLYILRSDVEKTESKKIIYHRSVTSKSAYLVSFFTVAFCTLINFLLFRYFESSAPVMIYFLGIVFVAIKGYFWPSFLTSILSVLAFGFFFVPPRFTFLTLNTQYLITLITMLLVSQVIANLALLSRRQAKFSQLREQRTATMYLFSKRLAHTRGFNRLLEISVDYIAKVFNSDVLALLPNQVHQMEGVVGNNPNLTISPKEQSVAQWVYELGQIAGLGTQTLPDSEAIYIPLSGTKGPIGVLRVLPKDPDQFLIPEQLHLLEGFSNQTAMALEVDRLQEKATRTELEIETDRVRNILLKYISDNMHPPLVDIMKLANLLIEKSDKLTPTFIQELGNKIYNNSEELNHLVNNLSQIARLEAGITLKKGQHSLTKVVNTTLNSLSRRLGNRLVKVQSLDALPKISFNKVFIEQVFFNIIENATKYTPPNTKISVSAVLENERIIVSIEDEGPGLALEEINRIFEKFYRGQTITHIKGMGLGLAICQKIINLHGGEIWAENRVGGGAVFRFTLPL